LGTAPLNEAWRRRCRPATPTTSTRGSELGVGEVDADERGIGVAPAFVGDFDGDGDIFWHGPRGVRDGMWAGGGGTFAARPAVQVAGSYVPAAGDYDGNGIDDVVLYAAGSAPDFLWLGRGGFRFTAQATMPVSGAYRVVRAADLNHDGRDEVLWYASPGLDHVWWHGTGVLDRASRTNVPLR
jgi:hypothetical protein